MLDRPDNPFLSLDHYREQFNSGLSQLLDDRQLSTFILVLANATQHEEIFIQLKDSLLEQYDYFVTLYQAELAHGNQIDVVDEDFLVFLKIYMLGFDQLKIAEIRQQDPWRYQFNHLRSFRPRRISSFHNDSEIYAPYDKYTFNFNKAFMQKECLWSGEINGISMDLYFNKYPFAEFHGIYVPEREKCHPQLLTEAYNKYIWDTTQQLCELMPGAGFGYNSYGAYASVNHLHFQLFIEDINWPVDDQRWQHNGGDEPYPLKVVACRNSEDAWTVISRLHDAHQPYNLIYLQGRMYIMPRGVQGSVDVPIWSSGFTWYELSGCALIFNRDDYMALSSEAYACQLNNIST